MGGAAFWDVETETGCEEGPGHIRECEQEEGSTTEGVDCEEGGPGEYEID